MSKAMKLALKDMGLSKSKWVKLRLEVEDLEELDGVFISATAKEEL